MMFLNILAWLTFGVMSVHDSYDNLKYAERNRIVSIQNKIPYYYDSKGNMYDVKTQQQVYQMWEYFIPKGSDKKVKRDVLKTTRKPNKILYRFPAKCEIEKKYYQKEIEKFKIDSLQHGYRFFRTYVIDDYLDNHQNKYDGKHKRYENIENGDIYSIHAFSDSTDKNKIGWDLYKVQHWAYCNYTKDLIVLPYLEYKFLKQQIMYERRK